LLCDEHVIVPFGIDEPLRPYFFVKSLNNAFDAPTRGA
jgi:hypothetical protein